MVVGTSKLDSTDADKHYSPKRFEIHEQYNPDTNVHDIALIMISGKRGKSVSEGIDFNEDVQPIELWMSEVKPDAVFSTGRLQTQALNYSFFYINFSDSLRKVSLFKGE